MYEFCLLKHTSQNEGANALALMTGTDIQVVKQKHLLKRLNNEKPNTPVTSIDVARVFRRKASEETISCSLRIKPADALKTLTHCFYS